MIYLFLNCSMIRGLTPPTSRNISQHKLICVLHFWKLSVSYIFLTTWRQAKTEDTGREGWISLHHFLLLQQDSGFGGFLTFAIDLVEVGT